MRFKPVIFLFALLFLFNSAGAGLVWMLLIDGHRTEFLSEKTKRPVERIEITTGSQTHLNLSAGSEFELNGQRYDIIRMQKQDGKTILFCLNDTTEKKLLGELDKSSENGTKQKNKSLKKSSSEYNLALIQSLVFHSPDQIISFPPPASAFSFECPVSSPPPRLA